MYHGNLAGATNHKISSPSPLAPPARGRLAFFALLTLNFCILAIRRPGVLTSPQFWAEDSLIFYRDQLVLGSYHALWKQHAGYLCVLQRLIAMAAAAVPAAFAPFVFSFTALAFAALSCSLFFLPPYRALIPSRSLRAALCILFAAGFFVDELIGNLTNVQWYLTLPAVILLARTTDDDRYSSFPKLLALALFAFLLALSSPQLMIAAPICCCILFARGFRRSIVIPGAILLADCIQALVVLSSPLGAGLSLRPAIFRETAICLLYRSVLPPLVGEVRSQLWAAHLHTYAVIAFLILAAPCIGWLFSTATVDRVRLLVALYLAVASVAVAMLVRGAHTSFASAAGIETWGGERYFFFAGCVFAYLVALSLSLIWPIRAVTPILFAAVFIYGTIADFRVPPSPTIGPKTPPSLMLGAPPSATTAPPAWKFLSIRPAGNSTSLVPPPKTPASRTRPSPLGPSSALPQPPHPATSILKDGNRWRSLPPVVFFRMSLV